MTENYRDVMWFPFCSETWVTEVARLTEDQGNVYSSLIAECHCWHGLPDDNLYLAGVCRMSLDEWLEYRPVMKKFFMLDADPRNHTVLDKRLEDIGAFGLIDGLTKDGLAPDGALIN